MHLLAKFDCLDNMGDKCLFLLNKLLLLLRRELSFILVILDRDQFCMTDLDFFFQQKFNLNFCQVDVSLALSYDQIRVLLEVPLIFDTKSGCITRNLDKLLLKS